MNAPPAPEPGAPALTIGFRSFVALIACLMAVTALGIDTMLPALLQIGHALGLTAPNAQQWIVTVYMIGFGVGQIIHGPLGDRYGRKPVLLGGLAVYVVGAAAAGLATSFPLLLAGRVVQGLGGAAARVLSISIVRDCYAGRQMARVMSLAFVVFLTAPIIAPSIGTLILAAGSWRLIFLMLAAFGFTVACLVALRLPETLHPRHRRPISLPNLKAAARRVLTTRVSIGYTLSATLMFGALVGFVNSAQQVFAITFDAARLFPPLFAACAGTMAVGSLLNARIVERVGTRRVSHAALLGLIAVAALHLAVLLSGRETLASFAVLQAAMMGCFALAASNFNAMAMEPLGDIAGTASSIQGCISTIGGAILGLAVGQSFDGTARPLISGYLLFGCASLLAVLATEHGRLFHPQHRA